MSYQELFTRACKTGRINIVRRLLKESNIVPTAENNLAIRLANYAGHIEVVKLLEQHGCKL